MSEPLHTVHVRVNDATTGQPTPVRIRIIGQHGQYYAPFGRTPHQRVVAKQHELDGGTLLLDSDNQYAYVDGTCEIQLPAGPLTVEVSKGPEYTPLRREITLGHGKISLRLDVTRWINL